MKGRLVLKVFTVLTVITVGVTAAFAGGRSEAARPAEAERADTGGAAGGRFTFTDASGATVTLDGEPQRIACLTDICTDILYELGLEPVAVKPGELAYHPSFYGERAAQFQTIGGSFMEPSVEDIAAVDADLVIGLGGVHDNLRDALGPIAPLYTMRPSTMADSIQYLRSMGELTGRAAEAEAAAERFVTRLEAYKAQSPRDKTVAIVFAGPFGFNVNTTDGPYGEMLAEVTDYPWPALSTTAFVAYSVEQVLAEDPDVIFGVPQNEAGLLGDSLNTMMEDDPLWGEFTAVQNGQVVDGNDPLIWIYGRGTRSLSIVLDEVMTRTYPEVFPQPLR